MRELFDSGSVAAIITTSATSTDNGGVAAIRLLSYNDGSPCGPSVLINAGTAPVGFIRDGYVFSTFAMVCTMMTVWGLDVYHPDGEGEWTLFKPDRIEAANVYHTHDAIDLLTRANLARYYQSDADIAAAKQAARNQKLTPGIYPSSPAYNRRPSRPLTASEMTKYSEQIRADKYIYDADPLRALKETGQEKESNNKIRAAIDDFEKYPEFEDLQ